MTEYQPASVVPRRAPLDDHLFRVGVAPVRRLPLDRKAGDAIAAFGLWRRAVAERKQITIGAIPRMKCDAIDQPIAYFEERLHRICIGIIAHPQDSRWPLFFAAL